MCQGMEGDNGPQESEAGHSTLSPHGDWPPAPQTVSSAHIRLSSCVMGGYQGWGATSLPGPSLWQGSTKWLQGPHAQLVRLAT